MAHSSPFRWLGLALIAGFSCGCARGRPSTPATPPPTGYCSPAFQAQFGWPDPNDAALVCNCESRGNPRALAPGARYAGLFQFSPSTWKDTGGGDVFDPYTNSRNAFRLWQKRGWRPWPSCSARQDSLRVSRGCD